MKRDDQKQEDATRVDTQIEADLVATNWIDEDDLPELERFKLVQKLGQGGMGVVFLAHQTHPVERSVALKLIRSRVQNPTNLARFEVERQALAQMNHPAIAQVYDAGTTVGGQPWFAMEYVDGQRLDTFCREQKLTLDERLELFVRICLGVQHAHQRGIIHRDLKPANILVRRVDGVAMPKIIDFGIATASLEASPSGDSNRDVVGTPQYMSPEQFDLDHVGVDNRSDVYSLGVILYELLTDSLPIDDPKAQSADSEQMRAMLASQPRPPYPSSRVSAEQAFCEIVARRRRIHPRRLARRLRGDLDAIALKALGSDRDQRYASPQDLADDIVNARQFRPVNARPNTPGYRFSRFTRRHALGLGSASAVLLALLAGLTAATLGMIEAQRQFQIAEQRQQELAQVSRFQRSMLEDMDIQAMGIGLIDGIRDQAGSDQALGPQLENLVSRLNAADLARGLIDEFILEQARLSIDIDFSDQPGLQADLLETVYEVYRSMGAWNQAHALTGQILALRQQTLPEGDLRVFEAMHQRALSQYSVTDYEASIAGFEALLEVLPDRGEDFLDLRIRALQGLATTLIDSRHTERALSLSEESKELATAEWGAMDERTLAAQANLAYVRIRSGDVPGALEMFQSAADGRRQLYDETDDRLIGSLLNLGAILGASGRYEDALANDQEVFELMSRNRGLRHPDTQRAMNNIAAHMIHLGRTDEAVEILEQTLQLRRESVGALHPESLRTQLNLASAIIRLDQYEQSLALLDEVYQERRRLLGESHLDTMLAAELKADVLGRLERHDEAIATIEPVYQLRRERFGEDHRQTQTAAAYLGRSLMALGEFERGIDFLESAARAAQASMPADSGPALRRSLDFYKALLELKRDEEANRLRTEWLSILDESDPEDLSDNQRQMQVELLELMR